MTTLMEILEAVGTFIIGTGGRFAFVFLAVAALHATSGLTYALGWRILS